jgi:hypothetical protein
MLDVFTWRRQGRKGGQVKGAGQEVGPKRWGMREVAGRAWATRTGAEACGQHERDGRHGPGGPRDSGCDQVSYCTEKKELGLCRWPSRSVVPTHGQVHKGEHVELRHDGEA